MRTSGRERLRARSATSADPTPPHPTQGVRTFDNH
jgi:hypothetical protein